MGDRAPLVQILVFIILFFLLFYYLFIYFYLLFYYVSLYRMNCMILFFLSNIRNGWHFYTLFVYHMYCTALLGLQSIKKPEWVSAAPDTTTLVTLEVQSPGGNDSVSLVQVRSRLPLNLDFISCSVIANTNVDLSNISYGGQFHFSFLYYYPDRQLIVSALSWSFAINIEKDQSPSCTGKLRYRYLNALKKVTKLIT